VTEEEEDFVETAEEDVEEEGEATMEVAASEGIEAVGFGVIEAEAVVAAEEGMVDRPVVASKASRSSPTLIRKTRRSQKLKILCIQSERKASISAP